MGLYVPGGLVAYPSSVVMNVVPAQVAGVASLAVSSPPKAEFGGLPNPAILAACALLGVDEVYAVGGAQAVAMFAYGAGECRPVDVITGPGNVFVAAAKRLVQGRCGIDSEAGPTEIGILADDSAVPAYVAADLVAQAEHDPLAACLLVTPSEALLDAVDAELAVQVPAARHSERIATALAGQSAHVLVDDLDHGLQVVDAWAAEHLEVVTEDASARARRVRNAGAVFIGNHTPVSLGDYLAGSNHVLPDRRDGPLLGRPVGAVVPQADVADRVLRRGPGHRRAPRQRPRRGRGPRQPRRGRAGPGPVMTLPVRDDLKGKQPYGAPQAGRAGVSTAIQLNVNENPYPPSPSLVAALAIAVADAAPTLNRYPDREAVELRTSLAAYLSTRTGMDLAVEQVWAANGSNEVLQQVLQAFGGPGRTALGFEPSYSMHPILASGTGTGWVAERRADDFTLDVERAVAAVERHRPDVVFLTRPNNPTGTGMDLEVVDAVCRATDGMVLVDEAYAEFSAAPSAVWLLADHPRLMVSRTMSKAFAMAGTRLGYLAASAEVVDALRLVRLPYHLSALTQVVARTALAHTGELLGTVEQVKAQRDRIVAEVQRLGLTVVPTEANFLLFGPFEDPAATWQALLDRGVLVRDVSLRSRPRRLAARQRRHRGRDVGLPHRAR